MQMRDKRRPVLKLSFPPRCSGQMFIIKIIQFWNQMILNQRLIRFIRQIEFWPIFGSQVEKDMRITICNLDIRSADRIDPFMVSYACLLIL